MSINAAVGIETGADSYAVGANACKKAVQDLEKDPHAVLVFASSTYDQEKVLSGVRSIVPDATVVGGSTAGEITQNGPARKHSVAVMALVGENVGFHGGVGLGVAEDDREAGRQAVRSVLDTVKKEDLKTFLMFPDVLQGNGSNIVRGVLDELGENFPVIGGAPGDDFQFKETYQYLNDDVYSGTVVGLGVTGDVDVAVGVRHGWIPIGPSMTVTRSEGSVVHEIDNKPAISVYEEYFGKEEAEELKVEPLARLAITYPLGIKIEDSNEMLVRDPLSVDENGAITCAAEVPEGSEVRLMIGNKEEAIKVARAAAAYTKEQLGGKEPKAVIIFNCIARNKLFGQGAGEEIEAIREEMGENVPIIGFYTYGEQAPLGGEVKDLQKCSSAFHNETVVIAAFA